MKKIISILVVSLAFAGSLVAQRKVSELTLVYETSVTTGSKEPKLVDAFDGATKTIYIKGNMSRAEIVSALFSSATIHDSRTGNSVVLREVSGQKLLIRMTAGNWSEINKRYDSITFTNTEETKVIAGYRCTKAVATLPDKTTFNVYYTAEIVPENREYDYQFKNLNGLPLEYELTQGKQSIRYTLSKINMNPVPASKFDIPKAGYREMTYDESKKINVAN
jgi:GLPGLI family protein